MKDLKVLDVTLRDGGCVNDFNFGQEYMDRILRAQEASGVDMIELGYIDNKAGSPQGRTKYCNEKVIYQHFLKHKKAGVTYLAMFDYGKYDPDLLEERRPEGIDGIRCAFHKKNRKDVIEVGKKVIEKGYEFYIQPMITMRYSDKELLELIEDVNRELPDASGFYIVDSFGEMHPNDMNRMLNLVDHNLIPSMTMGFHSHNNLQLSYANAMSLLQFPTNRSMMLDSSIMGMGKGAGNLCTELLLEHLNMFYGKSYQIPALLEVIDQVVNQLHAETYWGYSVEYYLSSVNHCTPSYAKHFYDKHMLPIDQVGELLAQIAEDKKISFDKDYAESLYRAYNEKKSVDDAATVEALRKKLQGKNILLLAPGKSLETCKESIQSFVDTEENLVCISLNTKPEFATAYEIVTRQEEYVEAMRGGRDIIVTSNISKGGRGNVAILNYKDWIEVRDTTYDSSGIIALNLLQACEVKSVRLAGFDGFSLDINDNYFDPNLRRPLTAKEAEQRNAFFPRFLKEKKDAGMDIAFLTPTKYQVL